MCVAPTCSDGVKNGDETQADCGPNCPVTTCSVYDCSAQNEIPQSECEALVNLFHTAGGAVGDGWPVYAGNWLAPGTTPCQWEYSADIGLPEEKHRGPQCDIQPPGGDIIRNDGYRHVRKLSVLEEIGSFTGTIPRGLDALEYLWEFNLAPEDVTICAHSGIGGTLPSELGDLGRLQELRIRNHNITGTVPNGIGQLRNLRVLNITCTNLEGAVPAWALNSTTLQDLALSRAAFTSIPEVTVVGSLLNELHLHQNHISGTIPPSIAGLGQLRVLDLCKQKPGFTLDADVSTGAWLRSIFR